MYETRPGPIPRATMRLKKVRVKSMNRFSILEALNDENNERFEPTVFTSWDQEDLERLPVRRPTDVVFLTHIILYLTTSVPSAIILYNRFSLLHGFCHWIMQALYCGPFTLMLHNHIHNNGVLVKKYAWLDKTFPYILEPLMGHTLHSYYYHHIKCHHVEGNGPDDLSSTLRYQRDDIVDFLKYWGRFMFFIWLELPLYFFRTKKTKLACEVLFWEVGSYVGMYVMAKLNFWPTLFVLLLPFLQMRIGLMVGNWGQHALVDEIDPDSDYRSSIVLIDVASNRNCFNDGKDKYDSGKALVFQNIDYIMMFVKLMQKDYEHLAGCLVPTGERISERASRSWRYVEDQDPQIYRGGYSEEVQKQKSCIGFLRDEWNIFQEKLYTMEQLLGSAAKPLVLVGTLSAQRSTALVSREKQETELQPQLLLTLLPLPYNLA
ncbi:hypothetical protein EYC84_001000 [Monilinia fructicola]|uniref:Fatty acid desaturase domain-containing protein n=1 Tax=Monilinia fructicola TaxID=38448 RepID=A0A5M9JIM5_MONFR|nr:hypothetical protein EYC84_001000 [Monilinia fructicola]